VQLLQQGAEHKNVEAMVSLANLLDRRGDYENARRWWAEAARQGEPAAAYNLGVHLRARGRSTEGEQWLRRAADAGYAPARRTLVDLLDTEGRVREAQTFRDDTHVERLKLDRSDDHLARGYALSYKALRRYAPRL
jgi:TPR repeat protein